MIEFRYEKEMYEPVIRWLEERGFVWAKHTCTPAYWQCDLAAGRFAEHQGRRRPALLESLMIELKLRDVPKALQQAIHYSTFVNAAFVALPQSRCERLSLDALGQFHSAGVGLLSVGVTFVEIIVEPKRREDTHKMVVRNLWRRRSSKTGEAAQSKT